MSMTTVLAILAAVFGGFAVAIQAPLNASLAVGLKSVLGAVAVSFGVGFVALMLVLALVGEVSALGRVVTVNPWLLGGGLLGAIYVCSIVWAVPTLGVLTAISALIFGQLAAALLMDAIGPFGLPAIAITWQRMLGVAMVAGGLVMTKL